MQSYRGGGCTNFIVFLNCISQKYFSTVFLNCISLLYVSTVFQTKQKTSWAGMQLHRGGGGESIALGVNLQTAVNTVNVTPSAINIALLCVSWYQIEPP